MAQPTKNTRPKTSGRPKCSIEQGFQKPQVYTGKGLEGRGQGIECLTPHKPLPLNKGKGIPSVLLVGKLNFHLIIKNLCANLLFWLESASLLESSCHDYTYYCWSCISLHWSNLGLLQWANMFIFTLISFKMFHCDLLFKRQVQKTYKFLGMWLLMKYQWHPLIVNPFLNSPFLELVNVRGRSTLSNVSSDISLSPLYIPPHRR